MKQSVIAILTMSTITLAACNNNNNKPAEKKDAMSHDKMAMDSVSTATTEKVNASVIKASFANVSADVLAHISEVMSHYFHIKHALTKDDAA